MGRPISQKRRRKNVFRRPTSPKRPSVRPLATLLRAYLLKNLSLFNPAPLSTTCLSSYPLMITSHPSYFTPHPRALHSPTPHTHHISHTPNPRTLHSSPRTSPLTSHFAPQPSPLNPRSSPLTSPFTLHPSLSTLHPSHPSPLTSRSSTLAPHLSLLTSDGRGSQAAL